MKLKDLAPIDKAHWELHLNTVLRDTLSLKKQIEVFLKGGELPNLKHPSSIHDWLEQPDRRADLEKIDG